MGIVKESLSALKPIIFVAWIIAAARLLTEFRTTDLNIVAMFSVYSAVLVIFLLAAFTGQLDRLAWKGLFVGAIVLGVTCWGVPNAIAYSVAQFQGWDHGRFHVDEEHWAVQKRLMEEEEMGYFESADKAAEEIGRAATTRGPPIADTTAGKLKAAGTVAFFTTVAGTLWSLVLGLLLIGIPASVRRRRGSALP